MVYNPANLFIGNTWNYEYLKTGGIKTSYRFTAQESKIVTGIKILFNVIGVPPTYKIGIQEDASGAPSDIFLSSSLFTPTVSGWHDFILDAPVTLTSGSIYHIVIEYNTGIIDAANYITLKGILQNNTVIPLNKVDSNINGNDPALMLLISDTGGASWGESRRFKTPCFLLTYSDGTFGGQPFQEGNKDPIFLTARVGTLITATSTKTVSTIGFWINKKGTPIGNLEYEIIDINNNILRNGILTTPEGIESSPSWIYTNLTSDLTLVAGFSYRIVLKAPNLIKDWDNCYQFPYVSTDCGSECNNETYGGKYTSSPDGITWEDSDNIDIPFRLTQVALCPSPTASFTHSGESCI